MLKIGFIATFCIFAMASHYDDQKDFINGNMVYKGKVFKYSEMKWGVYGSYRLVYLF